MNILNLQKRIKKDGYIYTSKVCVRKFCTFSFSPLKHVMKKCKVGYNVLSENFKNCIILDACRFDSFVSVNSIEGELFKIWSTGSDTEEWYKNTFNNLYHPEIVYVSANPILSDYWLKIIGSHNLFYKKISVWKFADEELGTIHPKEVNKATLRTIKKFPEHKLIIHYMQPHYPYITCGTFQKFGGNIWKSIYRRVVDANSVKEHYLQNLKIVLEYVKQLLPYLQGKTIITSDHGELFGEYGFYGHPKIPFPELRIVPLLRVD